MIAKHTVAQETQIVASTVPFKKRTITFMKRTVPCKKRSVPYKKRSKPFMNFYELISQTTPRKNFIVFSKTKKIRFYFINILIVYFNFFSFCLISVCIYSNMLNMTGKCVYNASIRYYTVDSEHPERTAKKRHV